MSAEEEIVKLEQQLRAVTLPAARVNRDRLMFAAGAAAERATFAGGRRTQRIATGLFAATAAAFALFAVLRPASERVVYLERPAPTPVVEVLADDSSSPAESEAPAPAAMIRLRGLALREVWNPSPYSPTDDPTPSTNVTPTSLPRFDLNKAAGEAFPMDGRM